MKNLIIISGAPGSGKTTVGKLLQERLKSPYIDFGWLREFHLDREWTKTNENEERMAFENLVFILKNYLKNDYKNVIVTDLKDAKVREIPKYFDKDDYIIVSLTVEPDAELRKRVLGERDSGFKNAEAALEWNRDLKDRPLLPNEFKIDNSHNDPGKTMEQILSLL